MSYSIYYRTGNDWRLLKNEKKQELILNTIDDAIYVCSLARHLIGPREPKYWLIWDNDIGESNILDCFGSKSQIGARFSSGSEFYLSTAGKDKTFIVLRSKSADYTSGHFICFEKDTYILHKFSLHDHFKIN